MNFDLGYEVFVVPALWAILLITTIGMVITSFKKQPVASSSEFPEFKRTANKRRLRKAGITFVVGALAIASLVVVPPGHRGAIYTTSGVSLDERNEGYSLMVPVLWNANMVKVREQLYVNEEVFAQSADFLEFTMQIGVNYTIDPDLAADIFKNVGQEYATAIIQPAVLDISKVVLGQYAGIDIPLNRAKIRGEIMEQLQSRLGPLGINVTFVAVQDILGPPDWRGSVEDAEIAVQEDREQEHLADAAEHEADRILELATGEAEALERVAQAEEEERERLGMTPEQYLWYKVWNGVLPQFIGGGDGLSFILDSSVLRSEQPTEE